MRYVLVVVMLFGVTACTDKPIDNDFDRVEPKVTLAVSALDTLRFDPPTLRVRAGQEVTFKVTNKGRLDHQFNLEEIALRMGPGQTQEAVKTFATAGQFEFACRAGNHEIEGMVGRITVS